MPETKPQDPQAFMRPALKPFVRPAADESRPALRPVAPAFGRVTLPPFGPIRYGGPKPGASVVEPPREDDETPSWASIEEYVHETPAPELTAMEPEPEPEPEPVVDDTGLFDEEVAAAAPVAEEPQVAEEVAVVEQHDEPMPWEAAPEPEPEPVMRRPVLPLTGPTDPTPLMNLTIERTTERMTEPHRMTPMRVTPLRPAAIPAPSPLAASIDSNARAVAAALEMVAGRVRRGEVVVSGSMPNNDDPSALAAVLAATAAALLGVRL